MVRSRTNKVGSTQCSVSWLQFLNNYTLKTMSCKIMHKMSRLTFHRTMWLTASEPTQMPSPLQFLTKGNFVQCPLFREACLDFLHWQLFTMIFVYLSTYFFASEDWLHFTTILLACFLCSNFTVGSMDTEPRRSCPAWRLTRVQTPLFRSSPSSSPALPAASVPPSHNQTGITTEPLPLGSLNGRGLRLTCSSLPGVLHMTGTHF